MKADLAIYTHVLDVPGQYESVALMLSHKMDFNCCANRDGFRKSSHKYLMIMWCSILIANFLTFHKMKMLGWAYKTAYIMVVTNAIPYLATGIMIL